MKRLLSLVVVVLILWSVTGAYGGYAIFAQKKMELEARLRSLELQKEVIENKGAMNEEAYEEIRRLDEEILRVKEELRQLDEAIEQLPNATPKFNGLG